MPARRAPATVPQTAIATVNPRPRSESSKALRRALVVPEITAVSNPNNNPPKAATTVLFTSVKLSATCPLQPAERQCWRLDSDRYAQPKPWRPVLRRAYQVAEALRRYPPRPTQQWR